MQLTARFAEYGITGAFFWICQILLLLASGKTPGLLAYLSTLQQDMPIVPSGVGEALITGLAGALAVIAVFVAGLLLDLLSSQLLLAEMRVFKRHIDRNRDRLDQLIADHRAYCGVDYEALRDGFGDSSFWKGFTAGVNGLMFWNREKRERYLKRAATELEALEAGSRLL